MGDKLQKENGHIDIAHGIAEALCRTQFSGYESRIIWVIFRKTYGWHKKEATIRIREYVKMTELHRSHVCRTIGRLVKRKIITKNGNKYGFNKYESRWRVLPKMATVTKNGNNVTKNGSLATKNGTPMRSAKETIKRNTIKETADKIYEYYKSKIRAGARSDAVRNIKAMLNNGFTKDELLKFVDNYSRDVVKKNTEDGYLIQANNFFGKKARWEDYKEQIHPVSGVARRAIDREREKCWTPPE